jgi:hypothetical protein
VAHVVQKTLDEIVRHRNLRVPEPHLDLAVLREDMRNPGPPKIAIFGVTSRKYLPSAEQFHSHPEPSFEADTFALPLFEIDLD